MTPSSLPITRRVWIGSTTAITERTRDSSPNSTAKAPAPGRAGRELDAMVTVDKAYLPRRTARGPTQAGGGGDGATTWGKTRNGL